MEFRKQECQDFLVLANKVLKKSLLICGFCKADQLGSLHRAIRRGGTICSSERPDVQPATKLGAPGGSLSETLPGLREIIRAMKFVMRFSSRPENRKRQLARWRGMAESFPA